MQRNYLSINRDIWNADAANWVDFAQARWALETPEWGNWGNPETDLNLLPADMAGMNAVELGCGTGYVSYWMHRRGARVTGIDISTEQLGTARNLATAHRADITFIEGNAEATGLPENRFDFAISEYGASIWCPPDKWLTEAWRVLRPGGRLVFLGNHPLSLICSPLDGAPAERMLHRPYRDMWGADWTKVEFEPTGVCFNLTIADWWNLFADVGFGVTRYQELYAPDHTQGSRAAITADWAKSYPVEQVWHLDKL
ncbi:class I SAM-dependent methyltransferase [Roseobacter sinensis]|uniref:Class I SAM-dependent methyltransferase n=1 Tax=Roseobacter sinensis TaxID=2931391 RepID=A0ABT3BJQ5_9RHOB|nr:class I SAM-dependent methyltransferase [Roseobacter sp. WL0113]MCV3273594.1 class I SAM-dependent methyltransferase [Roseobacter sp. WL0113]